MEQREIDALETLNRQDAMNFLVRTFSSNGVEGYVDQGTFHPLTEVPDETFDPTDIELRTQRESDQELRWQLMDLVNEALQRTPLKPRERERIYLLFWKEMSFQQVGELCGRSKSSIHESYKKALEKIKAFLLNDHTCLNLLQRTRYI